LRFRLSHLIISILLLTACEEIKYNPLDSDNPDYIPPETTIITDINASTLNTSAITITFEGNDDVVEYSYLVDSTSWSDWTTNTSVIMDYLDEGEHYFSVKGRYITMDEDESPASVSFIVDAVQGPALRIFPLLTETQVNSAFTLSVYTEDMDSLVFGELSVDITSQGSDIVFISSERGIIMGEDENSSVLLSIYEQNQGHFTLAVNYANTEGVSGSGELLRLTFIASAASANGTATIDFSSLNLKLMDYNGTEIIVNELVGGKVVVLP